MRITYDKSIDAAYIYFADKKGKKVWTYCCDPIEVKGMINLDFNDEGRLMGIEVQGASEKLSPELLDTAEIIG